jgi:hypothetical protein
MRGCVYRLQLLPALAIAVILRSESGWNHDHIVVSQIRDSPILKGQVPVFISPRTRVAWLYPQARNTRPRYIAPTRTAQKMPRKLLRVLSLRRKRVHRTVP